jgi:ABC-type transport system substrate-binding protein
MSWFEEWFDSPLYETLYANRNEEEAVLLAGLIDELRVTLDSDRQRELYHEIHRLIYEDQPYTFLFADRRTIARHSRLENVDYYKVRPGYDLREWYSTTPRSLGR